MATDVVSCCSGNGGSHFETRSKVAGSNAAHYLVWEEQNCSQWTIIQTTQAYIGRHWLTNLNNLAIEIRKIDHSNPMTSDDR